MAGDVDLRLETSASAPRSVRRRFCATWDDVSFFDADYMARWGAFNGFKGAIGFEQEQVKAVVFAHDRGTDIFGVDYYINDSAGRQHVRSAASIKRLPCQFGGSRAYFVCPCCARAVLRLALLPAGLRCGPCGRITWASRRETEIQRLVRRANKLAAKLGLDHFADTPVRPLRMRVATYLCLVAELEPLRRQIDERARLRIASSRKPILAMAALVRWGL